MWVLFSYWKFALSLFLVFISFFVLTLIYTYPYFWYLNFIRRQFKQTHLFSLRFIFYFLVNNVIAPAISYVVSLLLLVIGSKVPSSQNSTDARTEMLTIILFPMMLGFFSSPFIAYYYDCQLLEVEDRRWLDLILLALVSIIFYIAVYHCFQRVLSFKAIHRIMEDTGTI